MPASSSLSARPIADSTSGEALIRRPCSSHVYQVIDTPASIATSSRRSPGARRWPPPRGRPTCSGVTASRRALRNSASSARWSIPSSRAHARVERPGGFATCAARVEAVGTTVIGVADRDVMVRDLERLVCVESPSHDVDALTKSADALARLIEERTGRAGDAGRRPGRPARALVGRRRAAGADPRPPRHGVPARHAGARPVRGQRRPRHRARACST